MIEYLILSTTIGFLSVLIGTPLGEKYLKASGIVGKDQQKPGKPHLPTSGGLIVMMGFIFSVTVFAGSISLMTDYPVDRGLIFAALSSATLIALIGLVDDIHVDLSSVLGEEIEREIIVEENRTLIHEKAEIIFGDSGGEEDRTGLSQSFKMLMVLPAALPLMAVGAGSWTMNFPVIGTVDWGLLYPLILLPVGLVFVSNAVNILAGTNGLSPGLSAVMSFFLGLFAFQNGYAEASAILFSLTASLLPFLYFNWYPASILPGDSLTYLSGAVIFSGIVLGNMEKFAVVLFLPYYIEFLLKARSRFSAHSWGRLKKDGTLEPLYESNYSLTHPLMRRGLKEPQISAILIAGVFVWASVCFLAFSV